MISETSDDESSIWAFFRDQLLKNALFIMTASMASAVIGVFFWIIAAKSFSPAIIGIASAMISSLGFILLISRLGLNFSLVRFFPSGNKERILGTTLVVSTTLSIIMAIFFIIGIGLFAPDLNTLQNLPNALFFLIVAISDSVLLLLGTTFNVLRKGTLYVIQNLILGVKIPLLFVFLFLGEMGIFAAFGSSVIISLGVSYYLIRRIGITPRIHLDKKFLKDSFQFSIGNYCVNLFLTAPSLAMPIIVINIAGPEQAAFYSIAYAVASPLFMISSGIATSLFVEGSHNRSLGILAKRALKLSLLILLPCIILINVFGNYLLGFIGNEYAAGSFDLVRILSISSIFLCINSIFFSIKRVQNDVKTLIWSSAITCGLLISFVYLFLTDMGIIGVGYGWLIGYGVSCAIIGIIAKIERWL